MSSEQNNINIERHVAQTEAQFQIIKARLDNVERTVDKNTRTNEKMDESVDSIKSQVTVLDGSVNEVKRFMEKLSSNVFLQFTNDIDLKKLISIILVVSTAISSPTIVSSWLNNSTPSEENEKIEKIIELLEKNEQP